MGEWLRTAGSCRRGEYDVAIGPTDAGWKHTGLHVLSLPPGKPHRLDTGDFEWLVLPLSGQMQVECGGEVLELDGRRDVFAGPSDFAYAPIRSQLTFTSTSGAQIALPHARASREYPFRRLAATAGSSELRGAGQCTREVRNFGMAEVLDADSILVCEVITPAGNWSSWPPHKHDEMRRGQESVLEEIYYFRMQAAEQVAARARPIGYHRVYGDDPRAIDVLAEVGDGDVVLVPYGWHGPSMTPPGYDMYYLNVMAGPERSWLITDDPDHSWVRQGWSQLAPDPRLPLGRGPARGPASR